MSGERPKSFGCGYPPRSDQPGVLLLRICQLGIWEHYNQFIYDMSSWLPGTWCGTGTWCMVHGTWWDLVHGVALEEGDVHF